MTIEGLFTLIRKLINLRLKLNITINFDGNGGFRLKTELGDESTNQLFNKYIN